MRYIPADKFIGEIHHQCIGKCRDLTQLPYIFYSKEYNIVKRGKIDEVLIHTHFVAIQDRNSHIIFSFKFYFVSANAAARINANTIRRQMQAFFYKYTAAELNRAAWQSTIKPYKKRYYLCIYTLKKQKARSPLKFFSKKSKKI